MHAASQADQSAAETPCDRSLRGESRRSDGTATTLRSSRADLAVFRGFHALGTSMRRGGCAGRSYPSHSTSRSPPTWWERGERREQVASMQPEADIGRVLAWACFVRRKFPPHLAYSDRKRASGCSHATSKHRAASAGLLATAGEPVSCTFLIPCIRDARVPLAAAQACVWNAASAGPCVRYHGNRCDLSEVAAPNGVRLQPVGIIWVHPASPLTTGRRDVCGRPR